MFRRGVGLWMMMALMPLISLFAKGEEPERVVPFPYGDMDHWVVREIHESGIIGGQTKWLYEPGPSDTIVGNIAFENKGGSPWRTSNVMAKVAGIVKTNTSVFPERRGDGMCARLETRYESVRVLGIVDIEVIAAGSFFLGEIHEPIRGTRNPQAMLCSGVEFTRRPKAIRFDYKVKAAPEKNRVRSTGFSRKSMVPAYALDMYELKAEEWLVKCFKADPKYMDIAAADGDILESIFKSAKSTYEYELNQ